MILIFAIAMILYVINGVFGLITQIDMLTQQDPIITSNHVAYFPEFSNFSMSDQFNAVISDRFYSSIFVDMDR